MRWQTAMTAQHIDMAILAKDQAKTRLECSSDTHRLANQRITVSVSP